MVEDLGQRPLARRARQRGRRVVAAHALVVQKAVEAAQRGGLAGDGGALQGHPRLGQALELLGRGGGEAALEQVRGAVEVALVGEQGIARRARLGGHHFEEGGDRPAILAGVHSRASASAAIIRAS